MPSLMARLQGALLTVVAVVLILFGAYTMGGRAARRSVEIKDQKRRIDAAEDRRDVEIAVERMPDDVVHERLRDRWTQD